MNIEDMVQTTDRINTYSLVDGTKLMTVKTKGEQRVKGSARWSLFRLDDEAATEVIAVDINHGDLATKLAEYSHLFDWEV